MSDTRDVEPAGARIVIHALWPKARIRQRGSLAAPNQRGPMRVVDRDDLRERGKCRKPSDGWLSPNVSTEPKLGIRLERMERHRGVAGPCGKNSVCPQIRR